MISLFINNADIEDITVFLLGEGISCESEKSLQQVCEKYGRRFVLIRTDAIAFNGVLCSSRWPKSAYMRMYAGELLPKDVHSVVYIDCDTVVLSSIQSFNELSRGPYAFQGVLDCIGAEYKKNIGLEENAPYVNAGVLAINLDILRLLNVNELIDAFLSGKGDVISYADQDVLNGAFARWIGYTNDLSYNVTTQIARFDYKELQLLRRPTGFYSRDVFYQAKANPRIVHYTTCMLTIRPWFNESDHPFAHYFDAYLQLTPFKDCKKVDARFRSSESIVFNTIGILPPKLQLSILGLLHSEVRPRWMRFKGNRNE